MGRHSHSAQVTPARRVCFRITRSGGISAVLIRVQRSRLAFAACQVRVLPEIPTCDWQILPSKTNWITTTIGSGVITVPALYILCPIGEVCGLQSAVTYYDDQFPAQIRRHHLIAVYVKIQLILVQPLRRSLSTLTDPIRVAG